MNCSRRVGRIDRVVGAEHVVDDLAHVADDRVLVLVALEPVVAEHAVDVVLADAAADVVVAEGAGRLLRRLRRHVATHEVATARTRPSPARGSAPSMLARARMAGTGDRDPGAGARRQVAVDEGVVAEHRVVLGVALDDVVAVEQVERHAGVGDRARREARVAVGRRQDHVQVAGVGRGAADDVVLALVAGRRCRSPGCPRCSPRRSRR